MKQQLESWAREARSLDPNQTGVSPPISYQMAPGGWVVTVMVGGGSVNGYGKSVPDAEQDLMAALEVVGLTNLRLPAPPAEE